MTGWLKLTDEQRITSIEQAAVISGLTAKAIEKDWWVTLALKALFGTPYAKYLIFKGGTSLSKGWKLIERFSEDIDIALDPEAFGRTYKKKPSHSYVKTLKKEGCAFTSTVLLKALKMRFDYLEISTGIIKIEAADIPPTMPDRDPQTIYVKYKSLYPQHAYIADEVKIEFSVRSLKDPYGSINIQSILSEVFPNKAYEEFPFEVIAVKPGKTLLEKAFLLHEKFLNVDADKIKVERLSRHLYDLVKMMNTDTGKVVLKDPDFYATLLEHRKNYIRLSTVDYGGLDYSTLTFIPPDSVMDMFRRDYQVMQLAMIYGDSPDFDTMIHQLKLLTGKFRLINQPQILDDIIKDAERILDDQYKNSKSTAVNIPVVYNSDSHQPAGPGNINIIYEVQFISKSAKWIFESITVKNEK